MQLVSTLTKRWVLIFLISATLLPHLTQAQGPQAIEVTKQDFLTQPKIVSSNLATFGVQLGMSRESAITALQAFSSQIRVRSVDEDLKVWDENELVRGPGESREQARDRFEAEHLVKIEIENIVTGYVIVRTYFEIGVVSKIEWDEAMCDYIAGKSVELLKPEFYTQDSELRLQLLGREDSVHQGVEVLFGGPTFTFIYEKEGLRLMETILLYPKGRKFMYTVTLVNPSKSR
jgi:hypothetical protein